MAEKNTLIREQGKLLKIIFPSTTDLPGFENVLSDAYTKSISDKFFNIEFNLKFVTWFESFQLSQFCLWLKELKALSKSISVILPESPRVNKFLEYAALYQFFEQENIRANYSVLRQINYKLYRGKPIIPLTFPSTRGFNEIIKRLQYDEYYNVIFEEVRDYAITRKAVIINIVMKEIGDNVFFHAKDKFSNFLVTRSSTSNLRFEKKYSPFEKTYLNGIRGHAYIEIIISDKGPGIPTTLKKNYLTEKKQDLHTDADIIEYALLEYSSSRTRKERLKELEEKLSQDLDKISPFTGLFQIKEIAKKYKGLLIIRSGKGIVSVFKHNNKEIVFKNSDLPGYKKLSNFGGTQIRLLLPIIEEAQAKEDSIEFDYREVSQNLVYGYISLYDFFTSDSANIKANAEHYNDLIEEIKTLSESGKYTAIIVDFTTQHNLDSKVLFMILCQIMLYQRRHTIVYSVVNLNSSLSSIVADVIETKQDLIKAPLVVFSDVFNRTVIGFDAASKRLYNEIIHLRELVRDEHVFFISTYPHLFGTEGRMRFDMRHNRKQIISVIQGILKKKLSEYICNPANGIYHENVKVLIPSGKYSPVYFEIEKFLTSKRIRPLAFEWFKLLYFTDPPDAIVSIGKHCSEFVNNTLKPLVLRNRPLHIQTQISDFEYAIEVLNLNEKAVKVLLFTDVIATAKSLSKMLKAVSDTKQVTIVAVINLTNDVIFQLPSSDRTFQILSLVSQKVEFYTSLPSSWAYEELMLATKSNNTLQNYNANPPSQRSEYMIDSLKRYGIIRYKSENADDIETYKNLFLEEIVIPNKAYYLKVYNSTGYMPVMYNINLIVELLSDHLSQDIVTDIFRLESFTTGVKFHHLIHLDYDNEPFKPIFKKLITTFPGLEISSIPRNHIDYTHAIETEYQDDGVIILDDAFTSGDMLFKLIDYCERRGARFIFCYILIKRSDFLSANKLSKLKKYGEAEILFKYIFDAELPVYKGQSNSITYSLKEISKLGLLYRESTLKAFISELEADSVYSNIEDTSIFSENNDSSDLVLLRWKLEQAKHYLSFRKEISIIFSDINTHKATGLKLFHLLKQEKHAFFDKNSKGYIFYESLKQKIIHSSSRLLAQCDELTQMQVFDILVVLTHLSSEDFFEIAENISDEKLTDPLILYPILVVLGLSDNPAYEDFRKYKLLERATRKNFNENQLLILTEKFWKSEDKQSVFPASSRVTYIRTLLKSSFHDLAKIIDRLETGKIPPESLLMSWQELKEMCRNAIYNLQQFFKDDAFIHIKTEFYSAMEQIHANLNIGDHLIQEVRSGGEKQKNAIYSLVEVAKNIKIVVLGKGLITMINANFRTEVKKEIRRAIEILDNKFVIYKEITDQECNAFCSDTDFHRIITNITENIFKHSIGNCVMIVVEKVKLTHPFIIITFYDDGDEEKKLEGYGFNTCDQLAKKYSGSFTAANKKTKFGDTEYHKCFTIHLHDLSSEIINSPSYAEETFVNN